MGLRTIALAAAATAAFSASALAHPDNPSSPLKHQYTPEGLTLLKAMHKELEDRVTRYRTCLKNGSCTKAQIDNQFREKDGVLIAAMAHHCEGWLENSFLDTQESLRLWLRNAHDHCFPEYWFSAFDGVLPPQGRGRTYYNQLVETMYTRWKPTLLRRFDTSLVASFTPYHQRTASSYEGYLQGTLNWFTLPPLAVGSTGARMAQAHMGGRPRQASRTARPRNSGTGGYVASRRAQDEQRTRDMFSGVMGALDAFVGTLPKKEDAFIVPGKATFNGFVFGDTKAGQGLAFYDEHIRTKMAQSVIGYASGVKRKWSTKTSDGRVKVDCWEYFPKYRATPSRISCIYTSGGVVVGGMFPSNEYDKGLLEYLGQQGFRMTHSLGVRELGYAMLQNRYSMDDMEVFYKRYNVRYDREKTYHESDFCFFPTRLKASLGKVLTCRLDPA